MGDSIQKFWEEQTLNEEVIENYTRNVYDIIDLYKLLSPLEKVTVKKLIRKQEIF